MGCYNDRVQKQNRNAQQAVLDNTKIQYQSQSKQKSTRKLALVRIQGEKIKELLHRSIVGLRFKDPANNKSFIHGSGVLLSRDLVLTAAHNIYDKNYNMEFQKKSYQVFEGADGVAEEAHYIEDWRYLPEFKTCQKNDSLLSDYAIIKLKYNPKKPITYNQFLELRPPCKCVYLKDSKVKLNIYGFPEYKQNYEPINQQLTKLKLFQYGHTILNNIEEANNLEFKITDAVTTLPGQNGCPIVVDKQIVAIHTANKKDENFNTGRFITQDLIHNVELWSKELSGRPILLGQKPDCRHKPKPVLRQEIIPQRPKEEIVIDKKGYKNDKRENQMENAHVNIIAFAEAQKLKQNAKKLKGQYKYELALEEYKKSMAIYEQRKGKNSIEVSAILINGIGDIYQKQGKHQLALDAYENGKEICLEVEGEISYNYAVSLERIADVYWSRADHNSALEYYINALRIKQRIKSGNSIESANTCNRIGLLYKKIGDYPKSLQYFRFCLENYKSANMKTIQLADTYNIVGKIYWNQKNYKQALRHYEDALKIIQSLKGKDSLDVVSTLMNVGIACYHSGYISRAIENYKEAIAIQEKHQLKHRDYANANFNLGNAYYKMKEYDLAANAYKVALTVYEETGLAADVKKSALGLARCLNRLDDVEKQELERLMNKYGVDPSEI